jgi:hypothetical protein
VVGRIFVVDRPDGSGRFASLIQGGFIDATGATLQLADAPDFDAEGIAYHIGNPGPPSSEVIQDGVGVLTGGVTISPVLGLPTILSPAESGALSDRTLRWKNAPGVEPSIHDMVLTDSTGSTQWEIFVDGAREKVILPRHPSQRGRAGGPCSARIGRKGGRLGGATTTAVAARAAAAAAGP